MAFEFDETNIDIQSPVDYSLEQIESLTAPIVEGHLEALNRGYFEMLHKKPETHNGGYNLYKPSFEDVKEHPFSFDTDYQNPDRKILKFYTREIRNTGYGMWKTLNFWISHMEHIFTGEIYFDKAALTSFDLYITDSGINHGNKYYGFEKGKTSGIRIFPKVLMEFMDFLHLIRSTYRPEEVDPEVTATFIECARMYEFNNTPKELIEFLTYCRFYKDAPCMHVKVNSSFMLSIVYTLDDKMNLGAQTYTAIINRLGNILEEQGSVYMKISKFADNVLSILEDYGHFKSQLDDKRTKVHEVPESEAKNFNNLLFRLSR